MTSCKEVVANDWRASPHPQTTITRTRTVFPVQQRAIFAFQKKLDVYVPRDFEAFTLTLGWRAFDHRASLDEVHIFRRPGVHWVDDWLVSHSSWPGTSWTVLTLHLGRYMGLKIGYHSQISWLISIFAHWIGHFGGHILFSNTARSLPCTRSWAFPKAMTAWAKLRCPQNKASIQKFPIPKWLNA